MSNHHKKLSRRKFIGQASCAAIGSTTFLSTIANLMAANGLAGANLGSNTSTSDYKALVCVLLAGGNDSFNMLTPKGDTEYADYLATRTDIALQQGSLLELSDPSMAQSKLLGLHPSMSGLHQMYENGDAAFIANIGTLVDPIANVSEYENRLKKLPVGLFSHSDQIEQWQTSLPQSREAIGWGGRMADMLKDLNTNQGLSMNISLSGKNIFQSGREVLEYSISSSNVEGFKDFHQYWGNYGLMHDIKNATVDSLFADVYGNVLKETFSSLSRETIATQETFKEAMDEANNFDEIGFSSDNLSSSLRQIARVISIKDQLQMNRQTFFITLGGWDHHNEVLASQQVMLGWVSNAITKFFEALDSVGLKNNVTLFSISDFARTLSTNGKGSDHAWGGNSLVAGGAVKGKRVYGDYPDLYLTDNPLIPNGRGHLIPTTSTDALFAELALWFGVAKSDLPLILPNIGNFYSTSSSANPIGFL